MSRYTDDYSAADREEYGCQPEPEDEDFARERRREERVAREERAAKRRAATKKTD